MIQTAIPQGHTAPKDDEPCCFCSKMTLRWTDIATRKPSEQVACCAMCSEEREPSEVPTKAEWFSAHR